MTNTLRITPGPWAASRDAVPDGYVQTTVYAESDGERVATVFRAEDNARLIALAPRMEQALRAITDHIAENPGYPFDVDFECCAVRYDNARAILDELDGTP